MPELAEVEFARALLYNKYVLPYVKRSSKFTKRPNIIKVNYASPYKSLVLVHDSKEYDEVLLGNHIVDVVRKGKHFWLQMTSGKSVLFHFGMSGYISIEGQEDVLGYKSQGNKEMEKSWPPRFMIIELIFDDSSKIAYCDPRLFGRIKLRQNPATEEPVSLLGIDPYIDGVDLQTLKVNLKKYKVGIKTLLLDQEKVFCGIGNWLADEICYQAGIHPSIPCHLINEKGVESLQNAITYVINTAVAVNVFNKRKELPSSWLFHHRWSKRDKNVKMEDGSKITFIVEGGRTTAVVLTRQGLYSDFRELENSNNKRKKSETNSKVNDKVSDQANDKAKELENSSNKNKRKKSETNSRVNDKVSDQANDKANDKANNKANNNKANNKKRKAENNL